ncbi:MAG: hypothetical protein LAQ69_32135 [Acidobacteriia bacterium]|nr:hypothetical protein [Terriglobia bacterium]
MRMPFPKYPVLALLMGGSLAASGASAQDSKAQKAEPEADSPVGVWRGESVCTTGAPSCYDEKVVYYIEAIADKPDSVSIRADKIVQGKAITMGSGPWQYNRTRHTLSMESEQRIWLLNISGKRIEGTLTLPGNVVFRRMTLTRGD